MSFIASRPDSFVVWQSYLTVCKHMTSADGIFSTILPCLAQTQMAGGALAGAPPVAGGGGWPVHHQWLGGGLAGAPPVAGGVGRCTTSGWGAGRCTTSGWGVGRCTTSGWGEGLAGAPPVAGWGGAGRSPPVAGGGGWPVTTTSRLDGRLCRFVGSSPVCER